MNSEKKQGINLHWERGNVILSGFMGSGKTAVGRRLAAILHMEFVDMEIKFRVEEKTLTICEINRKEQVK